MQLTNNFCDQDKSADNLSSTSRKFTFYVLHPPLTVFFSFFFFYQDPSLEKLDARTHIEKVLQFKSVCALNSRTVKFELFECLISG